MSLPMTPRACAALLAFATLLPACDLPTDSGSDLERPVPAFDISDGARGGNPHFFFLRPMVKPPSSFPGTFDPTLAPEVVVCAWSSGACADIVAHFTTAGAGSTTIRVEPETESYIVNWHTDGLDAEHQYRVRVSVDGVGLGYADVAVGATGGALRNVDTDEYIPLVDGRTLPIRFRIEHGAVARRGLASVAAGTTHTCGLSLAGRALCWGNALTGKLGHGSSVLDTQVPFEVSTGLTFRQIVAGTEHTCALADDGAAWCWGFNDHGTLGDGSQLPRLVPVAVAGGLAFESITAGYLHTCGVTTDHRGYCWGYDSQGALGTVGQAQIIFDAVLTPDLVKGDLAFAQLSAGPNATCGVSTTGQAYCWGYNDDNRLGTGMDVLHTAPAPVLQPEGVSFVSVHLGGLVACARATDGTAWCWGINELGSAGTGEHHTLVLEPQQVAGAGLVFDRLTVGYGHACGIDTAGQGYCWGFNGYGQAGPTMVANYGPPQPTQVPGASSLVDISAGQHHTCAVTASGAGLCWGEGVWGQLGHGSSSSSSTPVVVNSTLF